MRPVEILTADRMPGVLDKDDDKEFMVSISHELRSIRSDLLDNYDPVESLGYPRLVDEQIEQIEQIAMKRKEEGEKVMIDPTTLLALVGYCQGSRLASSRILGLAKAIENKTKIRIMS